MPVHPLQPVFLSRETPDWYFYILAGQLVILTAVVNLFPKQFSRLAGAVFNLPRLKLIISSESPFTYRSIYLSLLFFFSTIALFYLLTEDHFLYLPKEELFSVFIKTGGFIAALYLLKAIVHKVCGFIFMKDVLASRYILSWLMVSIFAGIILYPVNLCFIYFIPGYRETIVYTGLIILGVMWLYQMVSSLILSSDEKGVPVFYIFLYLCALEILPLVLLGKFFFN
ncbi:MAG: DUF4271 domain-containing protein [Bacteroidetes bacterium]|nr:DUF4271 domain-containing protein [Bacteroidota bacterium]